MPVFVIEERVGVKRGFCNLFEGLADGRPRELRQLLDYLAASDYFFLRLSMAATKVAADAWYRRVG